MITFSDKILYTIPLLFSTILKRGGFMDPFLKMEMNIDNFSKSDLRIYETIKADPEIVPRNSIVDLAKICKVSQPSITRFCQKLGFDKYADFKFAIYSYAKIKTSEKESSGNFNLPAIENYISLLKDLDHIMTKERLFELARCIFKSKHIFTTGVGQSFLPARLFEINLRKLGLYASSVSYSEISDIKEIVQKDDLIIVFSVRASKGALEVLYDSLDNEFKAKVLLITMTQANKYKNKVDYMAVLPPAVRNDYSLRLESQVEFFVFVDLLTSHLALLIDKEQHDTTL